MSMYLKKRLENGDLVMVNQDGEMVYLLCRNGVVLESLPDYDKYKLYTDMFISGLMIGLYVLTFFLTPSS